MPGRSRAQVVAAAAKAQRPLAMFCKLGKDRCALAGWWRPSAPGPGQTGAPGSSAGHTPRSPASHAPVVHIVRRTSWAVACFNNDLYCTYIMWCSSADLRTAGPRQRRYSALARSMLRSRSQRLGHVAASGPCKGPGSGRAPCSLRGHAFVCGQPCRCPRDALRGPRAGRA
jgi:hypothetical protein